MDLEPKLQLLIYSKQGLLKIHGFQIPTNEKKEEVLIWSQYSLFVWINSYWSPNITEGGYLQERLPYINHYPVFFRITFYKQIQDVCEHFIKPDPFSNGWSKYPEDTDTYNSPKFIKCGSIKNN